MLVEKEIIAPGCYWYTDEKTGLPRKLDVTPALTKHWHDQGAKMLSSGLVVPVPYEHDFSAHPMTPKEKLLNNAGEVKEYRLHGDKLFGVIDIQDDDVKSKIGKGIRWTSPWINSFTDGNGTEWNNVISHLALTTRPRVTKQAPFGSVAAALSMASTTSVSGGTLQVPTHGLCLSRAGRIVIRKRDKSQRPQYPMAFSLAFGGGPPVPPSKGKGKEKVDGGAAEDDYKELDDDGAEVEDDGEVDIGGMQNPLQDAVGDVKMEELLCDLLSALGVQMPENVGESEFKRALYEATMSKVKELSSKGQMAHLKPPEQQQPQAPGGPGNKPPNPLVQQEQQPMYMSLEDINKLPDPMKGVALAMYAENQKLRAELDVNKKTTDSLRDSKLKEEEAKRKARVDLIGRLSPRVKADLDAMVALPQMALSMGDGGAVVDPLAQTLVVIEKGLADLPRLLTTEATALSAQPQPSDGELTDEQSTELADGLARKMGAPPEKKAS